MIEWKSIQMKQSCINAITSWSELESVKNILIFLRFTKFYQQFIKEFSQIITLLTDLIKNVKKRNIKYCRDKLNFANVSLRRLNIMKLNDSKKNNDYFLFTLRNKLRNQKCQSELLKNEEVLTAIKLAALTM